jgi:predicted nucleotidyltransferase
MAILDAMASPPARSAAIDLDRIARELEPIMRRHAAIAAVWIFGSALGGKLRFDSDVDFAVLFRKGAAGKTQIIADLAARLESLTTPYPVDVVDLEEQAVIFAHEVLCSSRLVYEADRDRRVDFVSNVCVRAFDFRPTHELAVRGQKEGLLRRLQRDRRQ